MAPKHLHRSDDPECPVNNGAPVLCIPDADPALIFEWFNAGFGGKLLTVAIVHMGILDRLAHISLTLAEFQREFDVSERAAIVLTTALVALGLLHKNSDGRYTSSEFAKNFLVPSSPFNVADYLDLAADAAGVRGLLGRVKTNRPAGTADDEAGTQYIFREGVKSAMVNSELAKRLTLALAGRAKITAPLLAERIPLPDVRLLLDVGGGTGLFSIAYLQRIPNLKAIVLDLPEVLEVTREMAIHYGVSSRLETVAADMFNDPFPPGAEAILLSNVLHDWDTPECRQLIRKCERALPSRGRVVVHDALLADDFSGPLNTAIYSIILFYLTEGRAYSGREIQNWLEENGFSVSNVCPTLVHCSAMEAIKK